MGRHTTFTPAKAEEICDWIADGKSLRSFTQVEGNPAFHTIYRWLDENEDFAAAFARAREVMAHADADKINEVQERLEAGTLAPDVARVMGDCLKWTAARRLPRVYGDKVTLGGNDGAPLVVRWADGSD